MAYSSMDDATNVPLVCSFMYNSDNQTDRSEKVLSFVPVFLKYN